MVAGNYTLPKPPKVGKIKAQHLLKAIILHTFRGQVNPKPLYQVTREAFWFFEFGFGASEVESLRRKVGNLG